MTEENYVEFSSIAGYFGCRECGALVHQENLLDHDDWHERLRMAVDESEMLG